MAVESSLSKAWESKILKCLRGSENLTAPTLWIALYRVTPSRTATGTECSSAEEKYKGYARIKLAEASKWKLVEATGAGEGEEGYITNEEEIKFPECTGGEVEVESVAATTAETAGEQIMWGKLTEKKKISTTNTPASFAKETLKLKLS